MNRLTIEGLALGAHDRLLEVGFGSGCLLEMVLANNLCSSIAGVDVSREMIQHVSGRLRRYIEEGKAEIRYGDIESLPYGNGEFSKLCSVNTLYFWHDPRVALAECLRVLGVGGRLTLCFNAKADLAQWPGHVYGFTLYELSQVEEMLAAAGFSAIEVMSRNDPGQGLYYCVTGTAA